MLEKNKIENGNTKSLLEKQKMRKLIGKRNENISLQDNKLQNTKENVTNIHINIYQINFADERRSGGDCDISKVLQ